MAETPTSKSQKRALKLLSLTSDGTYDHSARILSAAGVPGDAIPDGHTWRSAAKLSDVEFRSALHMSATDPYAETDTRTTAEIADARQEARVAAKQARRIAYQNERELIAQGYRWVKVPVRGTNPSPLMDDWEEEWQLLPPAEKA